ncbi:MAG: phosphoribosylglycinamide formyltransferase [Gammaproteobacteria bacterium]|nr:phosphoribosylglycinamide formyltransferase [Gammaproteobacteria bacterium]
MVGTRTPPASARCRVVVLISGRGSNLGAIVDAVQHDGLPIELCAVISNRPDAGGLDIARQVGITAEALDHRRYSDRDSFDRALMERLDSYRPDLVVLAGFMRVLGAEFIDHYSGRLINIHPSLLPAFPGLHTHQRALTSGMQQHGATVHFVTHEVDSGPIIAQASVPILADDTAAELAARVLQEEHRLYPLAIRWFAEGRLKIAGDHVLLDGRRQSIQGLVT